MAIATGAASAPAVAAPVTESSAAAAAASVGIVVETRTTPSRLPGARAGRGTAAGGSMIRNDLLLLGYLLG